MGQIRGDFLDVAINIEAQLRVMLAKFYIPDDQAKQTLFTQNFLDRLTFGVWVARFKPVLAAVRGRPGGADLSAADQLSARLDTVVRNRNRFAHDLTYIDDTELPMSMD